METLLEFLQNGALGNFTWGNFSMLIIGCVFIYLGIVKDYEPLLLIPIGFGMLIGNIPYASGMSIGIYENGSDGGQASVLSILYTGVTQGWYPPLIFLGIGAMTDFSCMLANPRLILLGAAAQIGIFLTFIVALAIGFTKTEAASIGIIGGADGPTAIFLSSKLAPHLLGAIAVSAYSYMALVPVIQPPIIKLLTTRKERLIRMKPNKPVSKRLRVLFPVIAFLITGFIAPGSINLLGFLFFGNLLKESGVTERLAATARTAFIDIITILLGVTVGCSTDASRFLTPASIKIFVLGAASFMIATASGVLFAKLMNLVTKTKINPIIGAAGVSAVPDSARVCQMVGAREDPNNFLIMHAMAPNVAGVIGSAVAAGVLLVTFL
ncbi:MAG: glutaconyl-CoA decarboxylase subunit beta [candidate division Zixibacteria bacterium HGW-Zixibacteria-1]|nr:MAG: glutaconyl-CoA decarboxylase subunit beta [candidate division Zixibacteria bacterium HGW-Zixibacteria-1]